MAAALGSGATVGLARSAGAALPTFEQLYEQNANYIWRILRRLGVAQASLEDAVQEVFVVAWRKADAFEGRSSARTWLYAIAIRIARRFREAAFRSPHATAEHEIAGTGTQHAQAARSEALRLLEQILAVMDDDKREVFVLAEIEELSAPEIAEAIGVPLNTVYSRLRLARKEFDEAAKRARARDRWRL